MKWSLVMNGKRYQVVIRQTITDLSYDAYFLVSLSGSPFYMYKLSVLKEVLKEKKLKDPWKWVQDTGLKYIKNMIEQADFSRSEGIITSTCEASDWRVLPKSK